MGGDRRVVPGQLWRWALDFNDGWWMFQRVTTEGRTQVDSSVDVVYKDDLFMVMVVDDPGPYELPDFKVNENGGLIISKAHRWHVVLLRDTLYWFRHDWFRQSVLVSDT